MTDTEMRKFRQKHKLTQEQFGQIIGRNRETVSRYENGDYEIPFFIDAVTEKWERENDK